MKQLAILNISMLIMLLIGGLHSTTRQTQAWGLTPTPEASKESICLYLCWDEILADAGTWQELEPIIRRQDWDIVFSPEDSDDSTFDGYIIEINSRDADILDNDHDSSAAATLLVYKSQEGIIDRFEIDLDYLGVFDDPDKPVGQTWQTFSPSNVLESYGDPSSAAASVVFTGNGAERALTFVWEKAGLVATYSLAPSDDYSESVETCWDIEHVRSAELVFYKVSDLETLLQDQEVFWLPESSNIELFENFSSMSEVADAVREEECFRLTFVEL